MFGCRNKKPIDKKKLWQFAFATMVFLGALQLFGYVACWVIGSVLGGISFSVPAASVGIIAGADGRTAIFVTAKAKSDWQLILWILLLAVGIFGILKLRKDGKE